MKRIWLFITLLSTLLFVGNFSQANNEYEYTSLSISANILVDGTINVKENYNAEFFVNKHGIIRNIPLNYSVLGERFHIDVSNIDVQGNNFYTNKNNGEIEIKIGDPNKTVIGSQSYPISYSTYGLIRNYQGEGYSELYRNLVADDFDTNINRVRAVITLPKAYTGFTSDNFLITTDGKSQTIDGFEGAINWSKGDKITISYDKVLPAYQGITLAIKFPNDYFEFDHDKQAQLIGYVGKSLSKKSSLGNMKNMLLEAFLYFGCFALFMFIIAKKYFKKDSTIDTKYGALKGDFAKEFPVIVQYTPPVGINSAEASLLLNRKAEVRGMLSLIYKWAAEGLITLSVDQSQKIGFGKPKQTIIINKIGNFNESMPGYEQDLFRGLVRNEKNKIEESQNLYNRLNLGGLERYGEKKGWFQENSRKNMRSIGAIILTLFILGAINEYIPDFLSSFLFFVCLICSFCFLSKAKLKETEEGARLISHVLGYREFIKACDENKLKLFLQQDPLYFDKILPYAVAFGLETELLKKIEPIMEKMNIKSSWYNGDLHSIYTINNIISSTAIHSVPPSTSYSSSGGFSGGSSFGGGFSRGGGGGGGGGRSW